MVVVVVVIGADVLPIILANQSTKPVGQELLISEEFCSPKHRTGISLIILLEDNDIQKVKRLEVMCKTIAKTTGCVLLCT